MNDLARGMLLLCAPFAIIALPMLLVSWGATADQRRGYLVPGWRGKILLKPTEEYRKKIRADFAREFNLMTERYILGGSDHHHKQYTEKLDVPGGTLYVTHLYSDRGASTSSHFVPNVTSEKSSPEVAAAHKSQIKMPFP